MPIIVDSAVSALSLRLGVIAGHRCRLVCRSIEWAHQFAPCFPRPAESRALPSLCEQCLSTGQVLDNYNYADSLDGLILQGGPDIAPELYGQEPKCPRLGRRQSARRSSSAPDSTVPGRPETHPRHLPRGSIDKCRSGRNALSGHSKRIGQPGQSCPGNAAKGRA